MTDTIALDQALKALNLPTFRQHYQQAATQAAQANLGYEAFLLSLAQMEVCQRDANRRTRLIKQARFPAHKELADFDFDCLPDFNRQAFVHLHDQLDFIPEARPVIFLGHPGLGKTHLATSLGLAACRRGYKVRFFNAAALTGDLLLAHQEHRLAKFTTPLLNHHLIILDELGFIPFSPQAAQLLFQLCSALHERVSILVTTNLPFSEWTQVFGQERLTAALLDRLTFRSHLFEFRGESYRLRSQLNPKEATMT